MILINDAFVAGFMYNHTRTFLVSFQLQSTMDCQKAEQLIWTFRLWILFGSTIPWTARVAEHGGIFCFINSQGCVRLQLTMDWRFKFQQTDRVQPATHVQIQHEDLLQVTNGGWDVWMNHALVPWGAFLLFSTSLKYQWCVKLIYPCLHREIFPKIDVHFWQIHVGPSSCPSYPLNSGVYICIYN